MYRLSTCGYCWLLCVFVFSMSGIIACYFPSWLIGTLDRPDIESSIGLFRRCNYHEIDSQNGGALSIVQSCGRYSSFVEIPHLVWRIGLCLIASGCCTSTFTFFVLLLSGCCEDALSNRLSRWLGFIQFIGGLLIAVACILYPFGWDNSEVKLICGPTARAFNLGTCHLGWAFYMAISSAAGLCTTCWLCVAAVDVEFEDKAAVVESNSLLLAVSAPESPRLS